jgi:hypothetical protein
MSEQAVNSREILFRVLMGVGGHEFVIYTNGEIAGFGEGAIIFNYYDALLDSARVHWAEEKGTDPNPSCPTTGRRPDLAGAGHSTPP